MLGRECQGCICVRCIKRVSNNCCELCEMNGYASTNSYCDNDGVLAEKYKDKED